MADKVSQVRTFDGIVHDIEDTNLTSEVDSLSTAINSEVGSLLSQMSELSSEFDSSSVAQSEVDSTQGSEIGSLSTAESELGSELTEFKSEVASEFNSSSVAQSEIDSTQNSEIASMSTAQSEVDRTQNSEIASLSTAESELGSEITRFESEVASDYIQVGDVDTDKGLYATSTSAYVKVDGTTIDFNSSGELGVVRSYRKEILYTNSIMSNYAAQTVTLSDDTSNYDAIFVRYQPTASGATSSIVEVVADGTTVNQLSAPAGADANGSRSVILSGTSATFSNGSAEGAVNNNAIIPINIYGVNY